MSVILGGVTCEEICESPEESIDEGGLHAKQSFLCDWKDRYKVANNLLGFVSRPPGSVGGTFTFSRPRGYPDSPSLFAKRIRIEGKGRPSDSGTQIQYTKAIVHAEFGTLPWVAMASADPAGLNSFNPAAPYLYATQEIDFSVSMLRLHPASFVIVDDSVGGTTHKATDYYNLRLPIAHLNLTLHRVPYLPTAAILSSVGKCNTLQFLGCDPYTVLFDGAKTKAGAYTDGSYTQELTYSFSVREYVDWNRTLIPGLGNDKFGLLQYVGTGANVVQDTDLNALVPNFFKTYN